MGRVLILASSHVGMGKDHETIPLLDGRLTLKKNGRLSNFIRHTVSIDVSVDSYTISFDDFSAGNVDNNNILRRALSIESTMVIPGHLQQIPRSDVIHVMTHYVIAS